MALHWLKSLTPRSLFGRTALILLVPIVTIQLVVSYVFIQRLYENVTEQMTNSLLPSLRLLLNRVEAADDMRAALDDTDALARVLGVHLSAGNAASLRTSRAIYDLSGGVVIRTLRARLDGIGAVDLTGEAGRVRFAAETRHGLVAVEFARNRVSASNPHQLLVLMVFVSTVATVISFLFLKNQVRPIRHLAEAAAAFGKGRIVPYRPAGATEVRQAGAAFMEMRARIERHIDQRTLMLSGVSHDLRTPLTRLKLGLSLLPEDADVAALRRDVDEMQDMVDTFLGFARLDATETPHQVDAVALARDVAERAVKNGQAVSLATDIGEMQVSLRPRAVERALENLLGNACRHGKTVRMSVAMTDKTLWFRVEDDGPGIPKADREAAMRPFTRLDAARNQDRGGSVGLGLAIVADIARQHGGRLALGESEALGGLQADLVLAR